jgi:hypothetical protein
MSATARGRSGQPRRGGLDYLNGLIRASAYIQSFTAVPAHWRHSGGLIEYPLSTHGGNSNGYSAKAASRLLRSKAPLPSYLACRWGAGKDFKKSQRQNLNLSQNFACPKSPRRTSRCLASSKPGMR